MSIQVQRHSTGFSLFTLRHGDHTAVVSEFGGQLLSWTHGETPILFENREHAALDGKTPYRGGAPICFPYFGKGTLLPLGSPLSPQHGRARQSSWESTVIESENAVRLTTTQPAPEGYGSTEFRCETTYRLDGALQISAKIKNTGTVSGPFQLAVHSYWATAMPASAAVHGLGERYLDNLQGYKELVDPDSNAPHVPPIDRVYLDAGAGLRVQTNEFSLRISTQGGAAAVLWNPGESHGISDLGEPDFICVEVGQIAPYKLLEPGEEHVLNIVFALEPI